MTIQAGSQLGPYEIVSPLGAGGMGEVWLALDPRIGRQVAVKVLHPAMSSSEELVRRFEQEARTAGQLNHPNLIGVFDVGREGEIAYLVTELLQGDTLRERLAGGPLPRQRAIEWAAGIANGLAAAHEKGVVHRDLKPENVFITKDNRVKILDFGLARLMNVGSFPASGETDAPTDHRTDPGKVMGTAGYMSPEQVRAQAVDHRSDIFSFGAILYEMLTGVRAFHRDSSIETMNAILKEEPPEPSTTNPNVHPALERIVRHCLEKHPEARFQSARDLAFDLEHLSTASGTAPALPDRPVRKKRFLPAAIALTIFAVAAIAYWMGRLSVHGSTGVAAIKFAPFERLTFRRGNILHAALTPDGRSAVYSASWEGKPSEVFVVRFDDKISQSLGIEDADVLSVSSKGEIALLLKKTAVRTTVGRGTLARVPLGGGVPRPIVEDVGMAAWAPNGEDLAIARYDPASDTMDLEYPIGKVLLRSRTTLGALAVSPDGEKVSFVSVDETGRWLSVVTRDGTVRKLARGGAGAARWLSNDLLIFESNPPGLASLSGSEIRLVDLEGHDHGVAELGDVKLRDAAPDGTALFEREIVRASIAYGQTGMARERELGWLDFSFVPILTATGQLLFTEAGEGGGPNGTMLLRAVDASPPLVLGEGTGVDISHDGKWVLALKASTPGTLYIVPTGAGSARAVTVGMTTVRDAKFCRHDRQVIVRGRDASGAERFALYDPATGGTSPLPIESARSGGQAPQQAPSAGLAVAPDGERVAYRRIDGKVVIQDLAGKPAEVVRGSQPGDVPAQWSEDGRTIWVVSAPDLPLEVWAIDLASGRRTLWKRLAPEDMSGVVTLARISIAPSGKSWAYAYVRVTDSDLYTARLTGAQ